MENIYNFFGDYIYHGNDNFTLTQQEQDILLNLDIVDNKNRGNNFVSVDMNIFKNNNLKRVEEYFNKKIDYYFKEIFGISTQFQLTNNWITINKKNGYHIPHRHRNSIVSIIYYPQAKNCKFTVAKESTNLELNTNLRVDTSKVTPYNSTFKEFTLKNNDVIIFPSWVLHEGQNPTDEDKVLISSNTFFKGQIGHEYLATELCL